MFTTRLEEDSPERAAALDAFRPERFGFRPHHAGWVKGGAGPGAIVVAPLSWQHAHAAAGVATERDSPGALGFLVRLQERTWGMPAEEVVPVNLLAVLADTGGSVLVAYDPKIGFGEDGWLGFAIALGARSGTLVSHMLGVRQEVRGSRDVGFSLKLIQAFEALRSGHASATWTFDPMRGANARLNIEKLGARIDEFTVDKYGVLRSDLYGPVPSDRLAARWDLLASATAERVRLVFEGRYRGPTPEAVADFPEVTPHALPALLAERPPRLRYRIPGDIDGLTRRDPMAAIRWRQEMRTVLSALLTTHAADAGDGSSTDPARIAVRRRSGAYAIDGLATGRDATGERSTFYLLERTGR